MNGELQRDAERRGAERRPPVGAPAPRMVGGYGCGAWWWVLALLVALWIVALVVRSWLWQTQWLEPHQRTPPTERVAPDERGAPRG